MQVGPAGRGRMERSAVRRAVTGATVAQAVPVGLVGPAVTPQAASTDVVATVVPAEIAALLVMAATAATATGRTPMAGWAATLERTAARVPAVAAALAAPAVRVAAQELLGQPAL